MALKEVIEVPDDRSMLRAVVVMGFGSATATAASQTQSGYPTPAPLPCSASHEPRRLAVQYCTKQPYPQAQLEGQNRRRLQ